jgi:hypothetical protein
LVTQFRQRHYLLCSLAGTSFRLFPAYTSDHLAALHASIFESGCKLFDLQEPGVSVSLPASLDFGYGS